MATAQTGGKTRGTSLPSMNLTAYALNEAGSGTMLRAAPPLTTARERAIEDLGGCLFGPTFHPHPRALAQRDLLAWLRRDSGPISCHRHRMIVEASKMFDDI